MSDPRPKRQDLGESPDPCAAKSHDLSTSFGADTKSHRIDLPAAAQAELNQLLAQLVKLKRFEIRRPLGMGGMGAVFEAYDRLREEIVALKTIRTPTPESIYRFKQEFLHLTNVAHPNIAPL